jgi:hypothetical protein
MTMPDIFAAADILKNIEASTLASLDDVEAGLRQYEALCNGTAKPERRRRERPRPLDGLLTADEAAARLRCSVKTLNGYVASGTVRYVAIGHGSKRPRKMFTPADLDDFVVNQTRKDSPACLSAATRARPTGNTTFKSEVIAFSARPNARPAVKPKR